MSNKIIIVGNGSSVLYKENGSLIDSFDTVVRFNSYKISEFEKYVGTKTNIWFTCNKAHINDCNSFERIIEHSWEWDANKDKIYQSILEVYPSCEKTKREFIITKIPLKNPSTGIIAICMMLEEDKYQKPIYITGFDWWSNDKHHYGDKEKRGTLHSPLEEHKLILNFINEGKVKFLE
jgi:hypothetical protein